MNVGTRDKGFTLKHEIASKKAQSKITQALPNASFNLINDTITVKTLMIIQYFFLREFQFMASARDDSFLLSD